MDRHTIALLELLTKEKMYKCVGHPLLCHNQPACILQRQRDWDRFEAMSSGLRNVEKRMMDEEEFKKIPEMFYGFHDNYKR